MFREALRKTCASLGHDVVGEAGDGLTAVDAVQKTAADVILLDLGLPELDGLEVVQRLKLESPGTRIVALTAAQGEYTLFCIEKLGIQGFIDKGTTSIENLGEALTAVANGRTWFSPEYERATMERKRNPFSFDKVLSDREKQVLALIGHSLSDSEIGLRLGIAPKTAETFRQRIMDKLNIHGTPKLIRFARSAGFTEI